MKSAAVTGATGFIGRWVVAELLRHGINVYALVRSVEKAERIFHFKDGLHIVAYDFETDHLKELIPEPVDVVYHFAWSGVSGEKAGDAEVQILNIRHTLKLVEQLGALRVQRFIGAGSLHEMECLEEMKVEKAAVNRGIMYKSAKLAAHYMAKVEVCRQGIQFYWPVITNAFGIGENSPRLINTTVRKLIRGENPKFTAGTQLYDFIYITDLAKAFWMIGEKGVNCRNYILGSGKCRPLREYLECVGRNVNPKATLLFGEAPFTGVMLPAACYNTASMKEDTGFVCEVSFEEGIRRMKQWVLEGEKDIPV